jgi:hypothetical protein
MIVSTINLVAVVADRFDRNEVMESPATIMVFICTWRDISKKKDEHV